MATYLELKRQAEELLQQAQAMLESEKAQAIKDVKQKIADYDLTAEDVGLVSGKTRGRKATVRKANKPSDNLFKGPAGVTWTGRGRKPNWVIEALASGKTMDDLR